MKTFSKLILMCATFGMIAIASCKKEEDPCEGVSCLNGGSCNNGTCTCATGYEGSNCGTEQRSKFLASYNVSESCNMSGNFNYTMSINTSATGVTNVVLNNFYGVGATVTGTVNGSAITIPSQLVNVNSIGHTFSGSGQVSGNILTLSYTVVVGVDSETCTATCTKQ
jgi:hypothetical protein